MSVFDAIAEALENEDFSVTVDTEGDVYNDPNRGYFMVEDWTSFGENVVVEAEFNPYGDGSDLVADLKWRIDNFDVNEYAEPYIEIRGQRGVPESIEDILESAREAGEFERNVYDIVAYTVANYSEF